MGMEFWVGHYCFFPREALSKGEGWSSRERLELGRSRGRENIIPGVYSLCSRSRLSRKASLQGTSRTEFKLIPSISMATLGVQVLKGFLTS